MAGDLLDALQQMVDLRRRAVELDNQQSFDIERIAGMHEFLGGMYRRTIHHLHAAGNDARADDLGHAFAAVFGGGKADDRRACGLRAFEDAHGHLGDDPKQAL